MPDDHSEVVPLLPIPNRTVKRLSADDSADARVKVGHRQASTTQNPLVHSCQGVLSFSESLKKSFVVFASVFSFCAILAGFAAWCVFGVNPDVFRWWGG